MIGKPALTPLYSGLGKKLKLKKAWVGEGKVLPLYPECLFNGKNIPCFYCCSDSDTITGILLHNMAGSSGQT
jgi:hypothetical protein